MIAALAATGAEAILTVERVCPDTKTWWWSVSLVRADGSHGAVAGQTPVTWFRTREAAREGYCERLRALREAGYR